MNLTLVGSKLTQSSSLNDLTEHCVLGTSTKKVLKSTLKEKSQLTFLNQFFKYDNKR